MLYITAIVFTYYRLDASEQVLGYEGNIHQSFCTLQEAQMFLQRNGVVLTKEEEGNATVAAVADLTQQMTTLSVCPPHHMMPFPNTTKLYCQNGCGYREEL